MNIRKMVLGDLPDVIRLSEQLGYPGIAEEFSHRFHMIVSKSDTALFVANDNGKIVGWIYLGSVVPLTSPPRAQIWGLIIDKSIRQKGIGKSLVLKGEQWAKETLGVNSIGVGSNLNRAESHLFYKKIGYSEKKTWVVYEKSLT